MSAVVVSIVPIGTAIVKSTCVVLLNQASSFIAKSVANFLLTKLLPACCCQLGILNKLSSNNHLQNENSPSTISSTPVVSNHQISCLRDAVVVEELVQLHEVNKMLLVQLKDSLNETQFLKYTLVGFFCFVAG